ncbi:MAG: hypothetical protein AAGF11_20445 [Myxococcota bacterium]
MMTTKDAKIWLEVSNDLRVADVAGLETDPNGWRAGIGEGGTVVFRLSVLGEGGVQGLRSVRSLSPPNDPEGAEVHMWTLEGDHFVSPAFGHGYAFRIEAEPAAAAGPVPIGGGHFHVVEEGGGL